MATSKQKQVLIEKSKTKESFMNLGSKPMAVRQSWDTLPKMHTNIGAKDKTS